MYILINAVISFVSQIGQNRGFKLFCAFCVFSTEERWKKNEKKFQTIKIDIKFDEEFGSDLWIGLPCKEKPGNRKNLRNNEGKFRKIEENFPFWSAYIFLPICKVWANLIIVFLCYEFFKNREVFPTLRLFFAIWLILPAAFNRVGNFA